jgi:tripartite ATP-independent transporter DctM subunit
LNEECDLFIRNCLFVDGSLWFYAKRRDYPRHPIPFTRKKITQTSGRALPTLILPIIILGGILGGVLTPTEAAAGAVVYALFLGFFVYRNLGLKQLYGLLYKNAIVVGIIVVIFSGASILAWLMAMQQIPQMVTNAFLAVTQNKYIILLLINLLLVFVGMFMDITASLLKVGPILAPLATKFRR